MLAPLPHLLLVLCVAWVRRLLSELLVHETKLRTTDLVHLISSKGVLYVIVRSVIYDLLVDLLLVVVLLVFMIIVVATIIHNLLMLTIEPWPSLMMPVPVESVMGSG